MREIVDGILTWSWFSEPHGYNFNGYLVHHPDGNLCDGAAEEEPDGFFDVDNIPPWDTWIGYVYEDAGQPQQEFDSYLISWIPLSCLALAQEGIQINPEECIVWADELDTPSIEQLRAAGLLARA